MAFKKQIEYGGTEDFRLEQIFEDIDYFDFYESVSKVKQKELDEFFDGTGHKIGGYAYFTQTDPRVYVKSNIDVLLLQIDTDEKIMFGDSGIANVFINLEDLKNKSFEKAWFNWDCC